MWLRTVQTAILVRDHSKQTNVIYKCERDHGDKRVSQQIQRNSAEDASCS